MKQDTNIDALMADAWLTGTELRCGARLADGEGERRGRHCVEHIEKVMAELETAGLSEASRRHILYAWCALLDETAKGREGEDDACIVWYDRPLQAKYFGALDAGDALYERMRLVLHEPAPDVAVLTCFHRVLMLGFKGCYALDEPVRDQLITRLAERVSPFETDQSQPVLAGISGRSGLADGLRRWPVCLGLSLVAIAALWLGLNHWLDSLITTLLPGAEK